jgi:hypothetical protein
VAKLTESQRSMYETLKDMEASGFFTGCKG